MIRKALRWLGVVEPDIERDGDDEQWQDFPRVRNRHARNDQTEEDESERSQP